MEKKENVRWCKFISVLPAIAITLLSAWAYLSFLYFELRPTMTVSGVWRSLKEGSKWPMIAVYHLCAAMALFCLWRVRHVGPGTVSSAQNSELLRELLEEYLEENGQTIKLPHEKSGRSLFFAIAKHKELLFSAEDFKKHLSGRGYRFCAYCWLLKPHRAHHCRQCGFCRPKMDHHCNWVEVCVGLDNYKLFLLFIFYAWATALVACLRLLAVSEAEIGLRLYLRTTAQLFTASLAFLLTGLNLFHLGVLTSRNRSTIEFCEGKEDEGAYARGWFTNWAEVFGKNPLFWLVPTKTPRPRTEEHSLSTSAEEESLAITSIAERTPQTSRKADYYR